MRALALSLGTSALTLCAVAALAQSNPFAGDDGAIAAGRAIYDSTCAACHGDNGAGGSGPPLDRTLTRAQDDATLFDVIHNGIPETGMPAFPALSQDNIWRVTSYVRSMNALAPVPLVAAADMAAGEALFFGAGNCAACHEMNGRGRDIASDLSVVGRKPVLDLRNAMAHERLGFRFVNVVTSQGTQISGFVQAEDITTLHLKQQDGSLRILGKAGLRSISTARNPVAIPPLEDSQADNIVAYLAAQKTRDLAQTAKLSPAPVLAYTRIATPDARNWVSPRGNLDGSNFSALSGITPGNVAQLQARWSARLGDGDTASAPLVVDGVLYASGARGNVHALDAQGGLPVWQFERSGPVPMDGNRGIAVLEGRVHVATPDGRLIALNAHSGRTLWDVPAPVTGAPLALRTRIITGLNSSDASARGALRAIDTASGAQMWRLETTPPEVTGAMTGSIGAYEAQNVTLYWSTTRATNDGADGDSILAVNANSGAVTWRHKLARGAGGDGVVIADQTTGGQRRALLLHLGRDGLLTVLDRTSGKPVRTQSLAKARVETPSMSFDRSSFVLMAALGTDVVAVDARSARVLWRAELGGQVTGVLATRGGVTFATLADGQMVALADGKILWRFRAGGPISTAPISYAIGGRQFIAVTAGNMVYAFALPQ